MRNRVEVLFRGDDGYCYLVELLQDPQYPESLGKLRCPGGEIEAGETAVEAAIREIQEEYGFLMEADDLHEVTRVQGPDGEVIRLAAMGFRGTPRVSSNGHERLVETTTPPALWI